MKEKQSELEEEMKAWAARYGVPLEYLRETGSTNVAARAQSYPNGTILLAERQTAGRGQRGNRWLSAPGENLTFSVVLHPDFLPVSQQFYLSKAVSLALTDTLTSCWPRLGPRPRRRERPDNRRSQRNRYRSRSNGRTTFMSEEIKSWGF